MWYKYFRVVLVCLFFGAMVLSQSFADEMSRDKEITALKSQVQQLMKRIEKLESEQAKVKEESLKAKEEVAKMKDTVQAAQAGRVDLANALSKLKLKGRAAIGFFDSGKAGSYPSGSFEVPDAKIQFAFEPDKINTVVMRLNFSNATLGTPNLDYFYLQSKDFLPFLQDTPLSLSSRLGRFKLGFGEETWSDNRVEGVLPSNSAATTTVTDEGIELAGKVKLDKIEIGEYKFRPLGWVVSVSDGNFGAGSDTSASKAFMGKLYYTPIDPLYLSYSYYDSGTLDGNAEMTIAGLATRPGNGSWERKAWEVFARYDFGKGKKPLDPPAYSDSKAILRLSYGGLHDEANVDREGRFGFVEGTYNLTKKFYTAGRYSFVDLDGDATATLNSVTANRYTRYSLGLGYRWSENTIIKLGYDWNKSTGQGASVTEAVDDADDNLISAVVGTQF